jgi:P27 family predicted phage terminase small subunit
MGERGPARKPATLRLLTGRSEGRDSGGREVELPPPFEREAPEPPVWLTGYGLEVWHRVIPELDRLQLVKIGDGEQLAVYCDQVARYAAAVADIDERGIVLDLPAAGPEVWDADAREFVRRPYVRRTANPAVTIARNAGELITRLAREFGLTPSSEGNLAGLDGVPKTPGAGADASDNPYAQTG